MARVLPCEIRIDSESADPDPIADVTEWTSGCPPAERLEMPSESLLWESVSLLGVTNFLILLHKVPDSARKRIMAIAHWIQFLTIAKRKRAFVVEDTSGLSPLSWFWFGHLNFREVWGEVLFYQIKSLALTGLSNLQNAQAWNLQTKLEGLKQKNHHWECYLI